MGAVVPAVVKPRVRVRAGSTGPASNVAWTGDSFVNFAARLGIGAGNQASASGYAYNFITRNRTALEAAYRGSWIVGRAVDIPADDMTRAGIEMTGLEGDDLTAMNAAINDLGLAHQQANVIRWARLFGGALGFLMIDGQDPATPLDLETIQKGQFRGIQVFDRWVINPTLGPTELVQDMGPSIGLPMFYQTFQDSSGMQALRIHHSRAIRQVGIELPYYQRWIEGLWGESVVERIWDRLVGFDSTTQGIIQLVYKAHLRVMKIKQLRANIAAGGAMATAMAKQFDFMRQSQSNEGLTLVDGEDEFEVFQYAFSGLDDILLGMGDQLCGALEITRARLFGQTPGGLAATGEGDLQNYDDGVHKNQERDLRRPWTTVLDVLHRSVLGRPPEPGFAFTFNPLHVPTNKEKADEGKVVAEAVVATTNAGITSQQTALRELRSSAASTGLFGSITDEEIDAAEDTAPSPADLAAAAASPGNPEVDDEDGQRQAGGARALRAAA